MIEVIGVYRVKAKEPCHLIEMRARGVSSVFDFGGFTQEMPNTPRGGWQVPWEEKILNTDGTKIMAQGYGMEESPELFAGEVRFAFFFHYLDETRPMKTPFGDIELPKPTRKPRRLSMIKYNPVD